MKKGVEKTEKFLVLDMENLWLMIFGYLKRTFLIRFNLR
jgi:hypothetical protein